jgi:hypothetical protein
MNNHIIAHRYKYQSDLKYYKLDKFSKYNGYVHDSSMSTSIMRCELMTVETIDASKEMGEGKREQFLWEAQ